MSSELELDVCHSGGAIWRTFARWRQVWCSLQGQPRVIHTWAPWGEVSLKTLYKYAYLYLFCLSRVNLIKKISEHTEKSVLSFRDVCAIVKRWDRQKPEHWDPVRQLGRSCAGGRRTFAYNGRRRRPVPGGLPRPEHRCWISRANCLRKDQAKTCT